MNMAEALGASYTRLQRQLLPLAEAMPENKYAFRPSPDVRTFGEQLRHIAAVQWVVGGGLLQEKPPVDVGDGDSGPLPMTAKVDIIRYTTDSFSYILRGIAATTRENALEMVPHPYDPQNTRVVRLALIAGYGWEHYGQMVVHLRLNGIAPPLAPL